MVDWRGRPSAPKPRPAASFRASTDTLKVMVTIAIASFPFLEELALQQRVSIRRRRSGGAVDHRRGL